MKPKAAATGKPAASIVVDKAYYADPIKNKMDNTMVYFDNLVPE
jgi:hypothetical protein